MQYRQLGHTNLRISETGFGAWAIGGGINKITSEYSGGNEALRTTLERQLTRLNTDIIDLYQIHWVPRGDGARLYDELYRIKHDGKVRFVGVSLYNINDIDYVIDHTEVDSIQLACNLL